MVHSTLPCKQKLFKLPQTDGVPDICSVSEEAEISSANSCGRIKSLQPKGQMAENTNYTLV